MTLPDGVERHAFDGDREGGIEGEETDEWSLATRGTAVYGEPTDGAIRRWDPHRSKLGAMFELGMDTGLDGGETTLYLGAAAGTTVSHVADFAGPTYAVEFAARPMGELLDVATSRPNLIPLLKDVRHPSTYAHVVEPVDVIVQDVATRGQARVARLNRQFLRDGGRLLLAIKARSENVTSRPADVFDTSLDDLREEYEIIETNRLSPFHEDHLGVVATPSADGTL